MNAAPSRLGLRLVAGGYAGVLAISVALIYMRYLQYARHADDVAASGGMWAGGDLILEFLIGCMLLAPTAVLVFVIRDYEGAFTTYAKVMLWFSVTLPLSLGIISIPTIGQSNSIVGTVCLFRLFGSPIVLAGLFFSRLFARFRRAKRLLLSGLLIEFVTLILIAVLFSNLGGHRG